MLPAATAPPPMGSPSGCRSSASRRTSPRPSSASSSVCTYTHISRYERGLSRPTAAALRRLADALGVSGDYLMEGATEEAAKARFEDRELLRQFQEVETLPDDDKAVVKKLLDAFLTKKQIQKLAAG